MAGIGAHAACRGARKIDPRAFGDDWQHCMLIDLDPKAEHSRLAFVGESLRRPKLADLRAPIHRRLPEGARCSMWRRPISAASSQRVPISSGGVGIHHGVPIIYRSILLPLSEGGDQIDGLLGAANYREIPVEEEIHTLRAHPALDPLPAELDAAQG